MKECLDKDGEGWSDNQLHQFNMLCPLKENILVSFMEGILSVSEDGDGSQIELISCKSHPPAIILFQRYAANGPQ